LTSISNTDFNAKSEPPLGNNFHERHLEPLSIRRRAVPLEIVRLAAEKFLEPRARYPVQNRRDYAAALAPKLTISVDVFNDAEKSVRLSDVISAFQAGAAPSSNASRRLSGYINQPTVKNTMAESTSRASSMSIIFRSTAA
jgi:hypothetical protein